MLGFAMWREARGEKPIVRAGVGHSILNRVNRPSWWGSTILEVLGKKWQYSSLTDPKDRQLTTWPIDESPAWNACLQMAIDLLDGKIANPCPGADSYHDISIPSPKWATAEIFVVQLGRIRFYNVDRDIEIV